MNHVSTTSSNSVCSQAVQLAFYLRPIVLGGLLASATLGCQGISTTTYHRIDQVEIGNAWKDSGQATQRMESSYREAWRIGYTDARQGKAKNSDQRKPAQFEAFQKHLREEAREEWARGYEDGYASGQYRSHQVDPYGHHQQLFDGAPVDSPADAQGNPASPSNTVAPDALPSDFDVPNELGTPPADPAAPTPPASQPETKPKYIDDDRVADSWSTLNSAIERSVLSNDQAKTEIRSLPKPQMISDSRGNGQIQSIGHPQAANPQLEGFGDLPATEEQIQLPTIDIQETFGLPEQNHSAQGDQSQPEALELGQYETTSNGDLKEQAARHPDTEASELELDLPEFDDRPISAVQDPNQSTVNQHLSSSFDDRNSAQHRSVSFDRKLELEIQPSDSPALGAPQTPLLSPRQLIRNQLPSRLPLRLRKR